MPDPHTNFAYSTVLTAPSPAASGTSLVVQAADGAKFPSTGSFNATVWPVSAQPTTANAEIVRVTAISTDTFTITRAQESTSARTIVVGDQIAATVTAKTLTDVELDSSYLTSTDQSVSANTQAIFDDYLELAASFVYEVASGAELVVGSYATPLPLPDQNPNIYTTVADETIPANTELVLADYYELAAPFAVELANTALVQVGDAPPPVGPWLPGYEIGYSQITSNANITDTAEATATSLIPLGPFMFDGGPVLLQFFCILVTDSNAFSDLTIVSLFEGPTQITRLADQKTLAASGTGTFTISAVYRFTPTAGLHTYKITAFVPSTTGTPAIAAGSGGTNGTPPAFGRFTKV